MTINYCRGSFTLILRYELCSLLTTPTVTEKCRSAIKALFLYLILCWVFLMFIYIHILSLVLEPELRTPPEHLGSCYSIFSIMCSVFRSLFVLFFFFFWSLCYLSFNLRILITPLVSSNSSYYIFVSEIKSC